VQATASGVSTSFAAAQQAPLPPPSPLPPAAAFDRMDG